MTVYEVSIPKKANILKYFFFQVFSVLKKERPENLQKIVPINGDVTSLGLGTVQQLFNMICTIRKNIYRVVTGKSKTPNRHGEYHFSRRRLCPF